MSAKAKISSLVGMKKALFLNGNLIKVDKIILMLITR